MNMHLTLSSNGAMFMAPLICSLQPATRSACVNSGIVRDLLSAERTAERIAFLMKPPVSSYFTARAETSTDWSKGSLPVDRGA